MPTRWSTISRLLFLVGFLALVLYFVHGFQSLRTCSCSPLAIWSFRHNQTFIQDSQDAFSLKDVTITTQEIRFFYAYTFSRPGVPSITRSSSLEGDSRRPIPLETTIQPLGMLDNVSIGVIHAQRINRPHQVIELHITPPGDSRMRWKLAPLEQVREEPHPGNSSYGFEEDLGRIGITAVEFYGPVMTEQAAYFRLVKPKKSTSQATHIFLKMDHPLVVSLITQEQYLSIARPENYQP